METIILIAIAVYAAFLLFVGFTDKNSGVELLGGIALGVCLAVYLLSVEVRTFVNETIRSTKNCTEWYYEEMYEAAKDNDIEEFRDLKICINEWILDLDSKDKADFFTATMEWALQNGYKVNFAEQFESRYNL